MALRFTMPLTQWVNSLGVPLAGGKLYFYAAGTTTPLDTYSDSALTTPNANPVVADSNGVWSEIFPSAASYKINLKTSAGVQVSGFPVDNLLFGEDSFVQPEKYGAIGDNVTDDFTAIQAALTNNRAVRLDNKTYGHFE